MVNFCGDGRLWKRSLAELSCDFDVENARSLIGRYLDQHGKPRRKGGTFCLFENMAGWGRHEQVGSWELGTDNEDDESEFLFYDDHNATRHNFYLTTTTAAASPQVSRLTSLYFTLDSAGTCLSFRYSFPPTPPGGGGNSTLSIYLFPCEPAYRTPVTAFHSTTMTSQWTLANIPLPDYSHPYRVVLEARAARPVRLDDVIFSRCGAQECIHLGEIRKHLDLWKESECRECLCLNGKVECKLIICKDLYCKYKLKPKPEGYCCEQCCPNQETDYSGYSGTGSGDYPDDEEDYKTEEYDDDYKSDNTSSAEYEDYKPDPTSGSEFDDFNCPIAALHPRSGVARNATNEAVCRLDAAVGPCTGEFSKFFYDSYNSRCVKFLYGGCEGNANNFETLVECERSCGGGGGGGGRNDEVGETETPPEISVEVCKLPADGGPCRGNVQRYYFNSTANTCDIFYWGGCGGNGNQFETAAECERICPPSTRPVLSVTDQCSLPKEEGNCSDISPRFFYDTDEDRCKLFVYSGCNGNSNRFSTPWQCRDACGGAEPYWGQTAEPETRSDLPERCGLPKRETRGCKAYAPMFYFDAAKNRCQFYHSNSCPETDNHFYSLEACLEICGGDEPNTALEPKLPQSTTPVKTQDPRCSLMMDEGPCKAQLYRYFYSAETDSCSVFIYGGCRGNTNQFESAEECTEACGTERLNFTVTLATDNQDDDVVSARSVFSSSDDPESSKQRISAAVTNDELKLLRESLASLTARVALVEKALQDATTTDRNDDHFERLKPAQQDDEESTTSVKTTREEDAADKS